MYKQKHSYEDNPAKAFEGMQLCLIGMGNPRPPALSLLVLTDVKGVVLRLFWGILNGIGGVPGDCGGRVAGG